MPKDSPGNNPDSLLRERFRKQIGWPDKRIAILVVHGIGNQKPLETLDDFARGVTQSMSESGLHYKISHLLEPKESTEKDTFWFDNFIRISQTTAGHSTEQTENESRLIDIYEYYWANLTENKTTPNGINQWLKDVTSGALKYYKRAHGMMHTYNDKSIFSDKKGRFRPNRYFFFIRVMGNLFLILTYIFKALLAVVGLVPYIGTLISDALKKKTADSLLDITNVIGDITIYNDPNPRSSNQEIRKEILRGCVKAIRCLLVPGKKEQYPYDRVVVVGHSLGSQVSFDAINRITMNVNLGKLEGYDENGIQVHHPGGKIDQVLDTFITFGSPLDKIAFFLTEQTLESRYMRRQMLANFHCFKQKPWNLDSPAPILIQSPINRVFQEIWWTNYYDNRDFVSGPLDFYGPLENVNCEFGGGALRHTHSDYWESPAFYNDVLQIIFR